MTNKRPKYKTSGLPEAQGLYDPRNEHDACGVGMVLEYQESEPPMKLSQRD